METGLDIEWPSPFSGKPPEFPLRRGIKGDGAGCLIKTLKLIWSLFDVQFFGHPLRFSGGGCFYGEGFLLQVQN